MPTARVRALAMIALVGALVAGAADAAPVRDQRFDAVGDSGRGFGYSLVDTQRLAQTFTVGMDGKLAFVDVQAYQTEAYGANEPVTLELWGVRLDVSPNEDEVLASVTVPASALVDSDDRGPQAFSRFDVRAFDVWVVEGDVLAIVMSTTGTSGVGYWAHSGGYFTGATWISTAAVPSWTREATIDQGFRTWVDPVPEPGTALTLGLGLVALGRWRRWSVRRAPRVPAPVAGRAA